MADRVLQRRDTAANWAAVNPILAEGELGIITDGAKGYKIGDGMTRWNSLPYPANPTSVVQELGDSENAVMSQKAVTDFINELSRRTPIKSIEVIASTDSMSINSEGVIVDSHFAYHLLKFNVNAAEKNYYLFSPGSVSSTTLWKYSDETFNTPIEQIIGKVERGGYFQKVTLQEGYYAFCWNDSNTTGITPNKSFLIPVNKGTDELEKLYGEDISDYTNFEVLNSSFIISDDKKSAVSLLTGYSNRLQYDTNLYEDKFNMSTKIIPLTADSNGYFEFCFGKWHNLSGTIFSIGKDSEGSFMAIYRVNTEDTITMTDKYRITEFSIDLNKNYFLSINKRTENNSYFDITITNSKGLAFIKKITGKATGEGDTTNEGNGSDAGYAWGKVCYYAILGTMKVSNINFGYPVNKASLKLICSGHSFVEGNSIPQDKDKRYVYLLCSDLGLDDTMIIGRGGASTTSILEYISKQLNWLKSASYILFTIGSNDTDNSNNADKLGQINSIAESYGIKTIWLTISPRKGVGEDHPIMNSYIKEHFNYVDINPAFYLDDGVTLDTSAFLDATHPTVSTHEKIYNIIKAQCSYLYCV